jgi:hypothetical protein
MPKLITTLFATLAVTAAILGGVASPAHAARVGTVSTSGGTHIQFWEK